MERGAHALRQLRRYAAERNRELRPQDAADSRQQQHEIYAAVGLAWIPPELREGRDEILLAERETLPLLVTLADIRGDLHMHTTATDGEDTLTDMVRAAAERKLAYVAITDFGK